MDGSETGETLPGTTKKGSNMSPTISAPAVLLACDVLATGMIAGFLTMYCLTIGGYFTFMARTGRLDELQRTYPDFRRRTRLRPVYGLAMLMQLLIAIAALIAGWDSGPLGLVPAVCALPILLLVHVVTGFASPEEKFLSGRDLSDAELARYLRLNLPLHVVYACFYAASALIALVPALA